MIDGQLYRYSEDPTGKVPQAEDLLNRYLMQRHPIERSDARYEVRYQNIDDPEGRAQWIAGANVEVIDRQTQEVLGRFVHYNFAPSFGSNPGGYNMAWRNTHECPKPLPSVPNEYPSQLYNFVIQTIAPFEKD